jgi:hypothetical protein
MKDTRTGRPGGRPPIYEDVILRRGTVTLPPDYWAWARQAGGGNASEGLRLLLEELDQRQGAEAAASSSPRGPGTGAAPWPMLGAPGSPNSARGS